MQRVKVRGPTGPRASAAGGASRKPGTRRHVRLERPCHTDIPARIGGTHTGDTGGSRARDSAGGVSACHTTHAQSRYSRGWRPSANGLACTSAPPGSADSTTWSTRSWTTRSTRRWPGHADTIEVTLLPDGGVRVLDNGRGIPVDMHPVEKRPAVEVVLTTLHAGGKFDGKSYAVSGGLHGVGISVVNALSIRLDVEIRRDGYVWRQSYEKGAPTTPLERGEETDETGTTTTFWPDAGDLRDHHVELRDAVPAAAGDGVPQPRPVHHAAGRAARRRHRRRRAARRHLPVRARHRGLRPVPERLQGAGARLGHRVRRGRATASRSRSPCSGTPRTPSRCTPSPTRSTPPRAAPTRRASASALTSIINRYAREQKLLRDKDDNLTGEDVREGLTAIVSVKLAEPAVRGPDQDQARQHRGRSRSCRRSATTSCGTGSTATPARPRTSSPRPRRPPRARIAARQARDLTRRKSLLGVHVAAGQAGRLPVLGPGQVRDLRGRG